MNIFDVKGGQQLLFGNSDLRLIFCFILAFIVTFFLIPSIVEIARAKSLYAEPGDRKAHTQSTPTLGGLAIFTGLSLSLLIFFDFTFFPRFQYTIAGLMIIFFTGFKDDIIGITAYKKFFAQILAVMITTMFGKMLLTNLHGFLGVFEINYHISVIITLVAIVGIINCFNLMDGIDGLSSGLGILVSLTFGIWFYLVREYNWAMISVGLIGSLLAFFFFNVFGKKNKIFMGDTGSLILGFFLAIMAIQFNQVNITLGGPWHIRAAPAVSIGILMVPFFDTLRVFTTRILHNKSPFSADKTHIHHYLLQLGLSHLQATLVLFFTNILFILISFLLKDLTTAWLLIILLAIAFVLFHIPILLVDRKMKKQLLLTPKEIK
jgi:UDP-GlcNAc:undecaprenyl-phosphate/decaprenyl-phosphate GlcNAc-1-phosphate transferase